MSAPRIPSISASPLVGALTPVFGRLGRMADPVLTAARRSGITAVVVTASTLGLLGGTGEVIYPRGRFER